MQPFSKPFLMGFFSFILTALFSTSAHAVALKVNQSYYRYYREYTPLQYVQPTSTPIELSADHTLLNYSPANIVGIPFQIRLQLSASVKEITDPSLLRSAELTCVDANQIPVVLHSTPDGSDTNNLVRQLSMWAGGQTIIIGNQKISPTDPRIITGHEIVYIPPALRFARSLSCKVRVPNLVTLDTNAPVDPIEVSFSFNDGAPSLQDTISKIESLRPYIEGSTGYTQVLADRSQVIINSKQDPNLFDQETTRLTAWVTFPTSDTTVLDQFKKAKISFKPGAVRAQRGVLGSNVQPVTALLQAKDFLNYSVLGQKYPGSGGTGGQTWVIARELSEALASSNQADKSVEYWWSLYLDQMTFYFRENREPINKDMNTWEQKAFSVNLKEKILRAGTFSTDLVKKFTFDNSKAILVGTTPPMDKQLPYQLYGYYLYLDTAGDVVDVSPIWVPINKQTQIVQGQQQINGEPEWPASVCLGTACASITPYSPLYSSTFVGLATRRIPTEYRRVALTCNPPNSATYFAEYGHPRVAGLKLLTSNTGMRIQGISLQCAQGFNPLSAEIGDFEKSYSKTGTFSADLTNRITLLACNMIPETTSTAPVSSPSPMSFVTTTGGGCRSSSSVVTSTSTDPLVTQQQIVGKARQTFVGDVRAFTSTTLPGRLFGLGIMCQ